MTERVHEKQTQTCRFCKQDFPAELGQFYYGNFVCNNCQDIIRAVIER